VRFWRKGYLEDEEWPVPFENIAELESSPSPLIAYLRTTVSIGECQLKFGDGVRALACWSERVYTGGERVLTIILGEPGAQNLLKSWQRQVPKPFRATSSREHAQTLFD
jgi:hypothetical protein